MVQYRETSSSFQWDSHSPQPVSHENRLILYVFFIVSLASTTVNIKIGYSFMLKERNVLLHQKEKFDYY